MKYAIYRRDAILKLRARAKELAEKANELETQKDTLEKINSIYSRMLNTQEETITKLEETKKESDKTIDWLEGIISDLRKKERDNHGRLINNPKKRQNHENNQNQDAGNNQL